jgi:hypothetical protein
MGLLKDTHQLGITILISMDGMRWQGSLGIFENVEEGMRTKI